MRILIWIIIGSVVGIINEGLILGGTRNTGLPLSIALGISGALIGGGLGWIMGFQAGAIVFAGIGAIVVIESWRLLFSRPKEIPPHRLPPRRR